MTKTVDFLVVIHNHQPVGNFAHVFEESFEMCYDPQIKILSDHPGVRMSLHYSGPLLEWIEANRPGHIDKIARLVERGQVEMLSGGFYEPILSAIPEDDAIGQIEMMNGYIEKRFGHKPSGIWLTERIWDPCLPRIIARAGLRFTVLDDTHFYYAGLEAEDMFGYYFTEKHGDGVIVFPIDKTLRYSIPFKLPEETVGYLKQAGERPDVECVTYGDDGEKFGVWPGTHKWVYKENWLDNFYSALEDNSDSIRMTLFSEFIERNPAKGRVYLPMASYDEMMEWTLSTETGAKFKRAQEEISEMGKMDEWKQFLRGGLWDNFMVKYEEANRMGKRMLYVSKKLSSAIKNSKSGKLDSARRELYMGQCNCAYWHGLFGGLYLNYLRHAVYEHLIKAENIINSAIRKKKNWIEISRLDFDVDGNDEVIVESSHIFACFNPSYGGCLSVFDFREVSFSLTNTLTRREEIYHRKLLQRQADDKPDSDQPASIHDIVNVKEENLEQALIYDEYERHCFTDHLLDAQVTLENFSRGDFQDMGAFIGQRFDIINCEKNGETARLEMRRGGIVEADGGVKLPVTITKTFTIGGDSPDIHALYEVTNNGNSEIDFRLGIEFNLTLLASDAEDRYWIGDSISGKPRLKNSGEDKNVTSIGMRDDWFGFEVMLSSADVFDVWRFPVDTVSQSESGFERTYQGSCIVLLLPVKLNPSEAQTFSIDLAVKKTK
ncbi:Alpha-amylase [hydrothermal vent metagenome]|uniref:Alpha-amylase n=1 Tax=hydrothermal vent metagenome TaxID=652676 RepID=A0A3B1BSZ9_9ZZZZ